jgi:hypothetical protein
MRTSVTIQDIDNETANWINEQARQRGISIESLIIELIHKGITAERESVSPQAYHDLDSLAGTWSDEQAAEFSDSIADFEHVDEMLWQ